MNKTVNILLLLLLVGFTAVAMGVVFDLSISTMSWRNIPYLAGLFTIVPLLILAVGSIRASNRWKGWRDMERYRDFEQTFAVSALFMKRSITFTLIEMFFAIAALTVFARLAQWEAQRMVPALSVTALLLVELSIFLLRLYRGGRGFRVGVNQEIIVYFDREVHAFFYEGLQRVELYSSGVIRFQYRDDLVRLFPVELIEKEDRIAFRNALVAVFEKKNVFVGERLRRWA